MVFICQNITPAIIHQNHMHFCTRTSLTEMRSKSSSRLTCTATAKQTLEYR